MQFATRFFLAIALTVLLVPGTLPALAQDKSTFEQECTAHFNALDSDRNGKVTIQEYVVGTGGKTYVARKMAKEEFVSLDKDGNGVVTKSEFCVPPPPDQKPPEEQCEDMFEKMDTDKDGKVNLTELMIGTNAHEYGTRKAAKLLILTKDRNGDKMLSLEEFCKAE